eukprot:5478362-Pleurochrysis_carterae.AAC.3
MHHCQPAGVPRRAFKHCRRHDGSLGSSTAMSEEEVPAEPSVEVDISQPIADNVRIYDFFYAMGQDLGGEKKIKPCEALAGHDL